MKRFSQLYSAIDSTTSTNKKVDAMAAYFAETDPADAAWAVYFLSGGRPKRLMAARSLAAWAMEVAVVPEWLFSESYQAVGDLAETISLLLPRATRSSDAPDKPLHHWVENVLLPLAKQPEDVQRATIIETWRELDGAERYIWIKLITGGFRVGVSEQLVIRALARASGIEEGVIAHRLSGKWTTSAASYSALIARDSSDADRSRPFPFYLAYALEHDLESLGAPSEWQAEWKWDGIRSQLIRRDGRTYIWSRGGELITDRFPELVHAAEFLPEGTVLDGEIMPWKNGVALPFAQLQRRIGRKVLGPKILSEVPIVLIAYDLLELDGKDLRTEPISVRREQLEVLVESARVGALQVSPRIQLETWSDARNAHASSRDQRAEGLMLKKLDSVYGVGRRKGSWWKWKIQPFSVDAVMVYAQPGHGRRALLHTDYTFAVRDGETLVPFAKAYSGLTDEEIRTLDTWIRRNTIEKFGPVRHVEPVQVFELHFEGIQKSPRHKSGVAVRFPRIARWRTDKPVSEIDTVETLRMLMESAK